MMPLRLFKGRLRRTTAKYVFQLLTACKANGFDRVVIPCCGTFTVALIARQAGYEPNQIETSDVSSFSTIVGAFLEQWDDKKLLETLEIHPDITDLAPAALLQCLLIHQFPADGMFKERLRAAAADPSIRAQYQAKLELLRENLGGIRYEAADLRAVLARDYNHNTVIFVDPPVYGKAYEKAFQQASIKMRAKIPEFNFATDSDPTFAATISKPYLCLWYRSYYEVDGSTVPQPDLEQSEEATPNMKSRRPSPTGDSPSVLSSSLDGEARVRVHSSLCLYIEEVKAGKKNIAILANHPAALRKAVRNSGDMEFGNPPKWKLFIGDLKPDARVTIKELSKHDAFYYRSLFVKKMAETAAEQTVGYFIDGMLFGVVGFYGASVFRGHEQHISEVFGFNVWHDKFVTIHRLLMLFITCEDTGRWLRYRFINCPIARLEGIKTVCFCRYRKLKNNNGILKIIEREWMPERKMFRLLYQTDFHKRTFNDCIKLYLDEFANRRGLAGFDKDEEKHEELAANDTESTSV